MNLAPEVISSLKSLPCFGEVIRISLLAGGLSHTTVKVTTHERVFFAKQLNKDTAKVEVACSRFVAKQSAKQTSEHSLSPEVVYHDQRWLVTSFIDGVALSSSVMANEIKSSMAIALMAQLHQLSATNNPQDITKLEPLLCVERLLAKPAPFMTQQRYVLDNLTEYLTSTINTQIEASVSPNVLCHGDINFSNILIDNNQQTWLLDFECAHLAPVEFDIAMFIAVNNIDGNQIIEVVEGYARQNTAYTCNLTLLNHYLLYSYFINGLWYFDNNICDHKGNVEKNQNLFRKLAVEQWSSFDDFASKHAIKVPKLMSLLA